MLPCQLLPVRLIDGPISFDDNVFGGGSHMARTPFTRAALLLLAASLIGPIGQVWAQASTGHDHLTEVACVDVPPGKERPQFGCVNVGTVTGLHFSQASVYWHLRT